MGAELLLAALPAVDLSAERRQRLHEIVSGLSEQELQQLDPDDWDAGGPEELRRQLHEHVAAFRGPDERRDVVPLHAPLMPYELWVTGGLSWGDDPTDIWDCFCLLGSCPAVWSQLQEWACADLDQRSREQPPAGPWSPP